MKGATVLYLPAEPSNPTWSEREVELLAITLQVLQEHGYDRLTVEAVAKRAKASKATVYRRWPSKNDLVVAAVANATSNNAVRSRTGSLRGDLMEIGRSTCEQVNEHARTMRALANEFSHSPGLQAVMRDKLVLQRKLMIDEVLADAVERGEIERSAINEEIVDLLPGYLVFRSVVTERPPNDETVRLLVENVLLPSLKGRETSRS